MNAGPGSEHGPGRAHASANVDPRELERFDRIASRWWDPAGEFAPLHAINPLRTEYIERHTALAQRRVVDVGCGGGLLAEALAKRGAAVTGIDMAHGALSVARLHTLESGLDIDYRETTAEAFAEEQPAHFDVVTCMELLEHVPDPASLVAACARLARPGGHVFFSTLNRTAKAYLFAIVGAEHILRLLPRGTHQYARFIRPSELDTWARGVGLTLTDITGLHYNPVSRRYSLGRDLGVNYMVHAVSQ